MWWKILLSNFLMCNLGILIFKSGVTDWTFLTYMYIGAVMKSLGDRRGHGRMVVGFTTTCATSAYRH